ncbi:lysogenic conversion protein [Budviciaceae bacterium BWR-B9]|uniref:Lysogenic conversion protein n=1 Tax=Limnobaculum allomyrinae TaxID=2791986 RepID=A0ABS1IW86_9GAMM|nr:MULTISPECIES: lysogenic conversion protein [Limnobaculum]MBK5146021.1 lysogenic conversion protein [Limnobaculum allomyrinae]MBV7694062.1 lysogenic conversion protein [Limnobaculum sp. M2-1]
MYIRGMKIKDKTRKKWNIEIISLSIAFFGIFSSMIYTSITDNIKSEQEKNNIRTIIAYEISNNKKTLDFLDGTRNIGFDKDSDHMDDEPHAISLKSMGLIRIEIASHQSELIYQNYFSKLSILDHAEVVMIMNYYQAKNNLFRELDRAKLELKTSSDIDELDAMSSLLEEYFKTEYKLSTEILEKYKKLLPQEKNSL